MIIAFWGEKYITLGDEKLGNNKIWYNRIISLQGTVMSVKLFLILTVLSMTASATADKNNTTHKEKIIQKQIEKQMAREKKYAKEQRFYQGDEYDFKSKEIDPETLKDIKPIEPDYEHTNDWGAADNE